MAIKIKEDTIYTETKVTINEQELIEAENINGTRDYDLVRFKKPKVKDMIEIERIAKKCDTEFEIGLRSALWLSEPKFDLEYLLEQDLSVAMSLLKNFNSVMPDA